LFSSGGFVFIDVMQLKPDPEARADGDGDDQT
jgi:hypothetical protein